MGNKQISGLIEIYKGKWDEEKEEKEKEEEEKEEEEKDKEEKKEQEEVNWRRTRE